jgi:hypothetical protein
MPKASHCECVHCLMADCVTSHSMVHPFFNFLAQCTSRKHPKLRSIRAIQYHVSRCISYALFCSYLCASGSIQLYEHEMMCVGIEIKLLVRRHRGSTVLTTKRCPMCTHACMCTIQQTHMLESAAHQGILKGRLHENHEKTRLFFLLTKSCWPLMYPAGFCWDYG